MFPPRSLRDGLVVKPPCGSPIPSSQPIFPETPKPSPPASRPDNDGSVVNPLVSERPSSQSHIPSPVVPPAAAVPAPLKSVPAMAELSSPDMNGDAPPLNPPIFPALAVPNAPGTSPG